MLALRNYEHNCNMQRMASKNLYSEVSFTVFSKAYLQAFSLQNGFQSKNVYLTLKKIAL